MNDEDIEIFGTTPILEVIKKYGSCNITNRSWTGDSWILEKILARVLVDIGIPVFLHVDVVQSFFNASENVVTVICCRK